MPRGSVTPPERLAQIKALLDDGCSNREITKTLHVGDKTIKKYFPESGWTMKQAGDFSAALKAIDRL